jgi:hypothetical protein
MSSKSTARNTGHGDAFTGAKRGSAARLRMMGAERASPIRASRTRSLRLSVLRTIGVISRKMRPSASLKEAGPA